MYCTTDTLPAPELYKLLIQIITPRPIAWISTLSAGGIANLAPFSFSTAVGANPPTHLFCPANQADGRKKDTLANCEATGEYVVNVVPFALWEAMHRTSTEFPAEESEFAHTGLTPAPSQYVRPPRVAESPVQLECTVRQIIPLGTGPGGANIILGNIVALRIADTVWREGTIPPDVLDTVGRLGGPDYCRTTARFSAPRLDRPSPDR